MKKVLAAALLAGATGFLSLSAVPPVNAAETIAEEREAIAEVKKRLDELIQAADQGTMDPKEFRRAIIRAKQPLKGVSDNVNGIVRRDIFRLMNKAKSCAGRGDFVCAERHLEEARKLADRLRAG